MLTCKIVIFFELEQNDVVVTKDERQWYMPNHPVINPHKPENVRRVCDAESKCKRDSVNDNLLKAPNLMQNLVKINFRFEEHHIVLTADIKAVFLQVKKPPPEKRVLRVLWRSNPDDYIGVYEYTRHVFAAKR